MKRWFPIFFLGLSLLANVASNVLYLKFLESWTPNSVLSDSQPLGLFALLSVPIGLFYLWRTWGPGKDKRASLSRVRMRCGNVLLVLSVCGWIYFRVDSIVSAWVAETSTPDPLTWLWLIYWKSLAADLSLAIGGPLALWLKGIRVPPRDSKN